MPCQMKRALAAAWWDSRQEACGESGVGAAERERPHPAPPLPQVLQCVWCAWQVWRGVWGRGGWLRLLLRLVRYFST
jgi:hypothetical protein